MRVTPSQCDDFIEHVCWAHSWYKHLDLVRGGEFAIFLAADAGAGFESHERLHYTWKTTREYRERFGHLDYVWRSIEGEWARDAGDERIAVDDASIFTLHPWCSNDFNAIEVIASRIRDEPLDDIAEPTRVLLVALADAEAAAEDAFQRLDRAQKTVALRDEGGADDAAVATHRALDRSVRDIYDELRVPEVARVRSAVNRVANLTGR